MSEQHTPGPWRAIDQMLKANGRDVLDQCGHSVCSHCGKQGNDKPAVIQIAAKAWGVAQLGSYDPKQEHDQHIANARLIVAAPDLLEALKKIVEMDSSDLPGLVLHIRMIARAAIAKAEGRP